MVDDSAQLYTIEGFAAAFIILATAYLVSGTMSIYTPGDSHIADMQLEQIGSDVLAVMDTPTTQSGESDLVTYVETWNTTGFNTTFSTLLNDRASGTDLLKYDASVSYRNTSTTTPVVHTSTFIPSQERTGYEQAVRVTRLVTVDGRPAGTTAPDTIDDRKQVMLLEVLIWRG